MWFGACVVCSCGVIVAAFCCLAGFVIFFISSSLLGSGSCTRCFQTKCPASSAGYALTRGPIFFRRSLVCICLKMFFTFTWMWRFALKIQVYVMMRVWCQSVEFVFMMYLYCTLLLLHVDRLYASGRGGGTVSPQGGSWRAW